MAIGKRTKAAREGIDPRQVLSDRGSGQAGQGARQGEVRRDHRDRDESRRRSNACGPDGARRVTLPNGSGRTLRVGVFARGAKADEAKAAGADVVGAEDLVEKVNKGEIDFDRCIATPDMMPLVGRLGKVLGPRGIMPNPKVGTVTMDVTNAVKGAKGGSVEFRVEKAGIVQAGCRQGLVLGGQAGREHQGLRGCRAEGQAAGAKGHYINRVAISSTMGPGVKVEIPSLFGGRRRPLTMSLAKCAFFAGDFAKRPLARPAVKV